jgi:hypothetical protein
LEDQGISKPTEQEIHDKLFADILPKRHPNSVLAKNWLGWSYRGQETRKPTKFYREFDVSVFELKTIGTIKSLTLTGFEVKGYEKSSGKPPSFGEGLEQTLAQLEQGADFSYLVHPEPENPDDKRALKELCDRFAPHIGLIFVPYDLTKLNPYYSPYREAQRNPHTTRDRKRDMLTSLAAAGWRDAISELPLWCQRQEY